MKIHGVDVAGRLVDGETRCVHYHTDRDIIAIKFACCGTYYPCYECHAETADHEAMPWPKERFDERAVLCGHCGRELSVREYLACGYRCPACDAAFNPGCKRHYPLYFGIESSSH
ncbi:hypothetical protein GCM10025857_10140 [Alicyclobacillus contaminans]|uniref:CHY zinc finger protein n=1 Tax=Alicyclobacillus contaminans TaxID=392016 RepID=UPI000421EBCF|nr:CHY zinc finger protein [Alicyclobacillus contaminans]GMA49657.1 hypothetical protein GCM10025857_10140 [Alicyclobacillus contaminans]